MGVTFRSESYVHCRQGNSAGIFTVRKSSCGKVMFSQACVKNSLREVSTSASSGEGCLPLGLPRQPPPPADTPPRQTPLLGRHPQADPPEMGTSVDSTHPTLMHSCQTLCYKAAMFNEKTSKLTIILINGRIQLLILCLQNA